MDLQAGKKYKMRTRHFYKPTKVHIDYVLDNPEDKTVHDARLIVYRVWNKYRRSFHYGVEMYWQLAISNDWEYNLN